MSNALEKSHKKTGIEWIHHSIPVFYSYRQILPSGHSSKDSIGIPEQDALDKWLKASKSCASS